MNDELFQQLTASLKEGGAILRGKTKASRKATLEWPDACAVREKLGLSQSQFAALIGISPRTLQNWEQGHRRPEGTARVLLRIADRHPETVLEALHASEFGKSTTRRPQGKVRMASQAAVRTTTIKRHP